MLLCSSGRPGQTNSKRNPGLASFKLVCLNKCNPVKLDLLFLSVVVVVMVFVVVVVVAVIVVVASAAAVLEAVFGLSTQRVNLQTVVSLRSSVDVHSHTKLLALLCRLLCGPAFRTGMLKIKASFLDRFHPYMQL